MKQWTLRILKAPFYLLVLLFMLPAILCLLVWDLFRRSDRAQTKPLVRLGFHQRREKEKGKVRWRFTREDCEILLEPDESCLIRFAGEEDFTPLERSPLLTAEEQTELKKTVKAFQVCDDRDRDAYSPTTHYVAYLSQKLSKKEDEYEKRDHL